MGIEVLKYVIAGDKYVMGTQRLSAYITCCIDMLQDAFATSLQRLCKGMAPNADAR